MSFKSRLEKFPGYNQAVLPLHYLQAVLANRKYHAPAKKLRVIAVTGTNGKTTTCFMIWQMLKRAGYKVGLLTTVGWSEDGSKLHQQIAHMTTEKVSILNRRMRAVADAQAEFLVLEVTSHALSQFRILGVPIEIAVFTNITPEHLDYHRTFTKYRAAKEKLFRKSRFGVINADDPEAKAFTDIYSPGEYFTYGITQGDWRATEVELKPTGVEYACHDMRDIEPKDKVFRIKTEIPGKFNVYNSLAAVAVGKRIGLSNQQIVDGIASLEAVEGRMTRIKAGQKFEVIVDYAHQPDALQKVFDSVKSEQLKGKIIAVHGGAGRRDHSTREVRGEILGRESDVVIITEDDSRDEDPAEIAAMFVAGAEKAGKVQGQDLFVELDRKAAIRQAIKLAKPGDLVMILGKGHEKTILRADGAHPFEDAAVAREILAENS